MCLFTKLQPTIRKEIFSRTKDYWNIHSQWRPCKRFSGITYRDRLIPKFYCKHYSVAFRISTNINLVSCWTTEKIDADNQSFNYRKSVLLSCSSYVFQFHDFLKIFAAMIFAIWSTTFSWAIKRTDLALLAKVREILFSETISSLNHWQVEGNIWSNSVILWL